MFSSCTCQTATTSETRVSSKQEKRDNLIYLSMAFFFESSTRYTYFAVFFPSHLMPSATDDAPLPQSHVSI
jgi:hypothetical protein